MGNQSVLAAKPKKIRISVSLPVQSHEELERLAAQKKVSMAWVIRDAVDRYLGGIRPLFSAAEHEE